MKLKPCPWCGGEAVFGAVDNNYYVQCGSRCPVRPTTALKQYYPSLKEAAKVWNTRQEKESDL